MHSSRVRTVRFNGHLYGAMSAYRECPIAGWDTPPHPVATDACKILPCPKLRLRAVISCAFVQVFNLNASCTTVQQLHPEVLMCLVLNCIMYQ